MEKIFLFFDIANIISPVFSLLGTAAFIFIYSSFQYYEGKVEKENRFMEYKIAANIAAFYMLGACIWFFFEGQPQTAIIHIAVGLACFSFHSSFEKDWRNAEINEYGVKVEGKIIGEQIDYNSWQHNAYSQAQITTLYTFDSRMYRCTLQVPTKVYLTNEINDTLTLSVSSRNPNICRIAVVENTLKEINQQKLEKSRTKIEEIG
jgi:hypothetical protein